MLPLGTKAPDFKLKDLDGNFISPENFKDSEAFLVVFMCNHCPYVLHIIDDFSAIADEYQKKGVGIVGINSNDVETYPQDSPEKMVGFAKVHKLNFPYLYDKTQDTARAYRAACTPDFFLFDKNRNLVCTEQLDESRPGNDAPVTGAELKAAMDAVISGQAVSGSQKPSMGCNIKWKAGNEHP